MKHILDIIYNSIVNAEPEDILEWYIVIVSVYMINYILVMWLEDFKERKRKPYIVSKDFLKMEESAGVDISNFKGKIQVTNRYCTGNFIFKE